MNRPASLLVIVLIGALFGASCSPAPPPTATPRSSSTPDGSAAPLVASASASANAGSKEDIAPEAATGWRVVAGARSDKYMVAAANPHASRAGLAMLQRGGSAVDAAIAMAMVLTLVEPQSSGIGGGAFLLHFDGKQGVLDSYDGRETAPAKARGDMFLDDQGKPRDFFDAVIGGLSVGVPGELRMLEMAHKAHGKLAWKQLFVPAIELAEKGFEISRRLHSLLARDPVLPRTRVAGRYFYRNGSPKPAGSRLKNPELAKVLRAVADGGADAFYQGQIAHDIAAAVRGHKNPGSMTLADMKAYRAKKREPVCGSYRKYRLCGMGPPTSGGIAALQILGVLQSFDLPNMDKDSADVAHLFAEAGRLAYADRDMHVADPDFVQVPVGKLLDPAYLRRRARRIDPARSMGKASPGQLERGKTGFRHAPDTSLERPSTSHLVAVDAAGNAVSMTASIEGAFGSHIMVRGMLLNNELTDFSFVPAANGKSVANRVEPNKRPRSSMTPMVVLDAKGKRLVLALGSPGGSRIIAYVARVMMDVLDFRLDPQTAIARPNIVNRNGLTELERHERDGARVKRTKEALEKRGHQVKVRDLNSGLHAILALPGGGYVGGADPRREGLVLGE
jgi:gamma-glutamyltranspeptidase/glutathione hydrolase